MNKAVFLDRDGVMNDLVYNAETRDYEPPRSVNELKLYGFTIQSLSRLSENGYKLFLISNQPDYAKGKAELEDLHSVHDELHRILVSNNIVFEKYYYCYHHPDGINPVYSVKCECRKPNPFFILSAVEEFGLDKKKCWIAGDRDTDIICGKNAGIKTILIKNNLSKRYQGKSKPDFIVKDLVHAVEVILNSN